MAGSEVPYVAMEDLLGQDFPDEPTANFNVQLIDITDNNSDGMSEGMADGLDAAIDAADPVPAATTAAEEAAVEAGVAEAVAVDIGLIVGGVVFGLVEAGILVVIVGLIVSGSIQIFVINNSPYTLSTSPNPSDEQIYINEGSLTATPPQQQIPSSPVTLASSFIFHGSVFEGPSGAVWMSMFDANGNSHGGLCFAFSDPLTGSNSCEVAFNQVLQPWFQTFNSSPAQTSSAAILQGTPPLLATAGIAREGSKVMMSVLLANPTLLQVSGSAPVYLIFLGQACQLPDPPTAQNLLGPNWGGGVIAVSQQAFDLIPIGPPLTSGACLVAEEGNDGIYLMTWGQIFPLSSLAYNAYGFNFGTVVQLPATVIEAMPKGPVITG